MNNIIVKHSKNEVVLDKANYVGFTILELSKLHMYETYYVKLQPYFSTGKITTTLYRNGWYDNE